jgi:DtxR family Mn-dependent transcriptional regulator
MISQTEENYLKSLFHLSGETGEVNVISLSRCLKIKMPTVTSMMKKLAEKGLVHYESYKPLRLTENGRKQAGLIIRKHRLTEMFLVEKMGFGWENVHDIAEQIEHISAPEFFEKMDELLGYPKLDPHGEPIPDMNGQVQPLKYNTLIDCRAGETIRVAAVINTSAEFLIFLNSREIHLGLEMKVLAVEPFDNSMTVSYGLRKSESLSHTICERLLVIVDPNPYSTTHNTP